MMDNQLGHDVDMVPERDDDELVTYMSEKMTAVEGMHPLERPTKGSTDLVHYVTIADKDAHFIQFYKINQLI